MARTVVRFMTIAGIILTAAVIALCAPSDDKQKGPEKGFSQSAAPEPVFRLTPEEKAWLDLHPTIRIGVMDAWPPLSFIDKTGRINGINLDYMALLNQRVGGILTPVPGPFSTSMEQVKSRQLDALMDITPKKEREPFFNFTRPYVSIPHVIVARKNGPYFNRLSDLAGKTMAVEKGFYLARVLKKAYPLVKVRPYPDTSSALDAVAKGEADAYGGNRTVALYLMEKEFITNLQVQGRIEESRSVNSIGVRKDWPELAAILDRALLSLSHDETRAIARKWGVGDSPEPADETSRMTGQAEPEIMEERPWQIAGYAILAFLGMGIVIWFLFGTYLKEHVAYRFGSRRFRVITLLGLAFFVALICFLGGYTLKKNRLIHLEQIRENLLEDLKTADARIHHWVEQRSALLKVMGRDPRLINLTWNLMSIPVESPTLLTSVALDGIRAFFLRNEALPPDSMFFIVSPDYITLASLEDDFIGKKNPIVAARPDLARRAFSGEVVFIPPDDRQNTVFFRDTSLPSPSKCFMGPIQDAEGYVAAVMIILVDPSKDFSRALDVLGAGKTGETYAFDSNGFFLSKSRYEDLLTDLGLLAKGIPSALNLKITDPGTNLLEGGSPGSKRQDWPLTEMVADALRQRQALKNSTNPDRHSDIRTNLTGYRDYRGVPVFGAWMWDGMLNLGLATEIDTSEAMSGYRMTWWTVFSVLGITLTLSVAGTLFVLFLGEKTNRALLQAKDTLEHRVAERTAELLENRDQLVAAEEQTRGILNAAGEGIFGVDTEGACTFANPAALAMLGYAAEDIIGHNVHELIHHSHADGSPYPETDCPMARACSHAETGTISNEILWRNDGSSFPVEYTATPIYHRKKIKGAVITFRDITERKQAEEDSRKATRALKASEAYLSQVINFLPEPTFIIDFEGRVTLWNRKMEELTGIPAGDILGKGNYEYAIPFYGKRRPILIDLVFIPESDWSGDYHGVEKTRDILSGEFYLPNLNAETGGVTLWAEAAPIRDGEGSIIGAIECIRDISDRKAMEQALSQERERLQKILDDSPIGVSITTDSVMRFANPRFIELFNLKEGESTQRGFVNPDDRLTIIDQVNRNGIIRDFEFQSPGSDGQVLTVLATIIETDFEGEKAFLSWVVDITRIKKTEQELTERLDELSRFRRMAIGRELKMIDLKKEINSMLEAMGSPKKYTIVSTKPNGGETS